MNGWMWVLVIAGGIFLAVVALVTAIILFPRVIRRIQRVQDIIYTYRHNKKARLFRLKRTDWEGVPLPEGKQGELRITEMKYIDLPAYTRRNFERAFEMRGRDLGVDVELGADPETREIIVRWHKPKNKKHPVLTKV